MLDPVETTLERAKNILGTGSKTTQTVLGNPLESFKPVLPKPSVPQQRNQSPYAMVRQMRSTI